MKTLAQVNWLDGVKPLCRHCHGPCDPKDRDYVGRRLCPSCSRDEFPGFTITKKEFTPCKPTSK